MSNLEDAQQKSISRANGAYHASNRIPTKPEIQELSYLSLRRAQDHLDKHGNSLYVEAYLKMGEAWARLASSYKS